MFCYNPVYKMSLDVFFEGSMTQGESNLILFQVHFPGRVLKHRRDCCHMVSGSNQKKSKGPMGVIKKQTRMTAITAKSIPVCFFIGFLLGIS